MPKNNSNYRKVFDIESVDRLQVDELLEMVLDEQRHLAGASDMPSAEEYLSHFPQLADDPERALDLIYNEYLVRRQNAKETDQALPDPGEFLKRFPDHAASMQNQFQLGFEVDSGLLDSEVLGATANSESQEDLVSTTLLDRYEIREKLGEGGFAIVYQAWDRQLRRNVAIKIARNVFEPDSTEAQRFSREAESVARLSHPGILQIFEFGQGKKTRPFMVGQLANGGSLENRVQQSVDVGDVVDWMIAICDAVDYSHQFNVVHRDLKPNNILFHDGLPKIADFGLASLGEREVDITVQGDLVGTPAYMSPEQASGAADVDAKSDQYSLGVILYRLLTGRLPFAGVFAKVIHQTIHSEPPTPRSIRSNIPLDLQTICLKAMSKDRGQRYSSVREMAGDLRRYKNREPISARPIGWMGRLIRWCNRQPALATTLLVSMVLLAVVTVASIDRISRERDRFRNERDRANNQLFYSLINNAESAIASRATGWYQNAYDSLLEASELDLPQRDDRRLRELMIKLLVENSRRLEATDSFQSQATVTAIAADRKQRFVVVAKQRGNLELRSFDLRSHLCTLKKGDNTTQDITELRLLSEQNQVLGLAGDRLLLWQLDPDALDSPSNPVELATSVSAIAVNEDETHLAIGFPEATQLFATPIAHQEGDEVGLGDPLQTFSHPSTASQCLAFSINGERLFCGLRDTTLQCWSVDDGQMINVHKNFREPILNVATTANRIIWTDGTSYAMSYWVPDLNQTKQTGQLGGFVNSVATLNQQPLCTTRDGALLLYDFLANPKEIARGNGFGELQSVTKQNHGTSVFVSYTNGHVQKWELSGSRVAKVLSSHQPLCIDAEDTIFHSGGSLNPTHRDISIQNHFIPVNRLPRVHSRSGDLFSIENVDLVVMRNETRQVARQNDAHKSSITQLSIDEARDHIATLDRESNLKIWTAKELSVVLELKIASQSVSEIQIHDHILAMRDREGVLLFDLDELDGALELTEERGTRIATGNCKIASIDGLLAVVESSQLKVFEFSIPAQQTMTIEQELPVRFITLTKDTSTNKPLAAVIDSDDTLSLWELEDPASPTRRFKVLQNANQCSIDPLGRFAIVSIADSERNFECFDLQTGRRFAQLGYSIQFSESTFSSDGKFIWLAGFGIMEYSRSLLEQAFLQPEMPDNPVAPTIDCDFNFVVPGRPLLFEWTCSVSPDQRWMISAGHDRMIRVRRLGELRPCQFLAGHDDVVWSSDFSSDSRWLATGSLREKRGEVIIWDTETWKPEKRFYLGTKLIAGLRFHPTRPLLAVSCFDGGVWLVNFQTGETVQELVSSGPRAMDVEFDAEGRFLAVARTSGGVSLFEISEPSDDLKVNELEGISDPGERIWTTEFSSDGTFVATATQSGFIRLYRFPSLEPMVTIKTSCDGFRQIIFTSEDEYMGLSAWSPERGVLLNLKELRRQLDEFGLDW